MNWELGYFGGLATGAALAALAAAFVFAANWDDWRREMEAVTHERDAARRANADLRRDRDDAERQRHEAEGKADAAESRAADLARHRDALAEELLLATTAADVLAGELAKAKSGWAAQEKRAGELDDALRAAADGRAAALAKADANDRQCQQAERERDAAVKALVADRDAGAGVRRAQRDALVGAVAESLARLKGFAGAMP